MTSTEPPVRKLPALTGYRAILFTAVFLTHALGAAMFFANPMINIAGFILPYGTGALSSFFVLSGFVLTWGEPWRMSTTRFWRRRIFKIYPGHVLVWAATLLLLAGFGSLSLIGTFSAVRVGPAIANLFLVQTWTPDMGYVFSVYGVNWSVSCELVFYLLLPLLIRPILRIRGERLRVWFGAMAAALIAIPLATHFLITVPHPGQPMSWEQVYWTTYFPLSRLPEFMLGVFLARMIQLDALPRIRGWWVAVLSVLITVVMFVLPPTFRISGILTISLCLVIPLIAQRDLRGKPSWLSSRPMVLLGNSSYAAYLVHFPLLALTRHLVGDDRHFGAAAGALIVIALFAVTQALGIAMFLLLERPIMRRFAGPRPRRVQPVPVVAEAPVVAEKPVA